MRQIITIFAVLAMTVAANANTFLDQYGRAWELKMPPKEYVGIPYHGKLVTYPMPTEQVREICSDAVGKYEDTGCALIWPDQCLIFINSDLPKKYFDAVYIHERAHCVGWPSDHPTDPNVSELFPDP
jgi:hypothetical protein